MQEEMAISSGDSPRPVYQLYNGDCMEWMKTLPDASVDMILTDPPYGISYISNYRTKTEKFAMLTGDGGNDRLLAYSEYARILKNNCVCVVFASWKNVRIDMAELEKYFDIKNVIVWDKGYGGMGDLKHTLSTDYELAIVCHKGKCEIRGKREGSIWRCNKLDTNSMVHPTEKPVSLFERMILKFTDAGALVMDSYCGSGTTGVACMRTGRRFIGAEINDAYFNIAKRRIHDAAFPAVRQQSMCDLIDAP